MSTSATAVPARTTENCRFCWMCRQACPVGHVTHRETYTPHAWALTIESVRRGQLVWNAESTSVLYACADCGLCQSHCATDQPLPDAIAATRADVVASGAAPAAVYAYDDRLRAAVGPVFRPAMPVSTERPGSKTEGPVFRPALPVAFFVGDSVDPTTIAAVTRLLTAAGIEATPIGEGLSTGSVAASLGLQPTALALAREVIADVETSGARELVVLTPGDRWAFEHVYPARLGLTWPATVAIREVTTVLAEALDGGRLLFSPAHAAIDYAYHDPCHSARISRDASAPRRLLEAAIGRPGLRTFWREGRAHPCGAIGGLEITHPDIAASLADARFADASAAGASVLVTEDPSCLRHLRARKHDSVDVVGMYELLALRI